MGRQKRRGANKVRWPDCCEVISEINIKGSTHTHTQKPHLLAQMLEQFLESEVVASWEICHSGLE